jgi:hypothetical protein
MFLPRERVRERMCDQAKECTGLPSQQEASGQKVHQRQGKENRHSALLKEWL